MLVFTAVIFFLNKVKHKYETRLLIEYVHKWKIGLSNPKVTLNSPIFFYLVT